MSGFLIRRNRLYEKVFRDAAYARSETSGIDAILSVGCSKIFPIKNWRAMA